MKRIAVLGVVVLTLLLGTSPVSAEPESAPSDGGSMMLVLDASGSMAEKVRGTTKIAAARSALNTVIGQLPDDQPVGLRVYGATVFDRSEKGACTDSQRVVALGTDNRDELRAALEDYKPYGETPIGHALREAAKDLGTEGQRTIVLVSDGEPTCDPDPCVVAADLVKQGFDLKVDVIGLDVKGKARSKLKCIADRGNGTYYDADSADDLVDTLVTAQTRASRPFDLTGRPVQGTTAADAAPTVGDGLWLDTFPADGESLWYRVERTAPGSTIHVGIAHRATGIGNFGEMADVALYARPGEGRCHSGSTFARGNMGYTGTTTAVTIGDCDEAEVVWVEVTPRLGKKNMAGKPMELAVYEEPPIEGLEKDLTVKPERPTWTPLEPGTADASVVPGSAVSNAPVVSDGSYAFDINPGETQAVAIPLDWGQDLQAQFDGRATRRSLTDFASPSIQIAGPLRQEVGGDYTDTALSDDWTSFSSIGAGETAPYRWGRQAFTVAPMNRFHVGDWWGGSAMPGLRYVLVSLPEDAAAPVEYTLTLKTNGTAGDGAPEYRQVDGLNPPQADSRLVTADGRVGGAADEPEDDATDATDAATPSADEKATDDDGIGWAPVVGGAAALLVLGAAGVAVLLRRRSRTTRPEDPASGR